MQKTANVLLILTPEEQQAVQDFIGRRLQTLDPDLLTHLQALTQIARQQIQRLQIGRNQYSSSSSRSAQIMAKLHDATVSGLSRLITEGQRTASAKARELKAREEASRQSSGEEADGEGAEGQDQKLDDLLLPCTPEEEGYASSYIEEQVTGLRLPELKLFRDACHDLLTWWESERGQMDSLHFNQFGDINSAKGRVSIRQKREELRQEIFNPFKAFFQELNTRYQRTSREAASGARQQTEIQKNAAGR